MMKRKYGMLFCALFLAAIMLCGCGSAGSSTAVASGGQTEAGGKDTLSLPSYGTDGSAASVNHPAGEAKRIYSASLEMETTGFDEAAKGLAALVESCGGYFQSSSVSSLGTGYRNGQYTIRVPVDRFQSFLDQAGNLCHVTRQTSVCDDVSESYYDTQGRLATQKTKLERLRALLAKAEKMEDIITLENAISDTETQIESLSGTLQHYDALADDATVTMNLSEVYRLSNTEEPAAGFGGRFTEALSSGWKNFVGGIQSLLVALAYGWVWLVLLTVAAVAAALLFRNARRKKEKQVPTVQNGQTPTGSDEMQRPGK